MSILKSDFVSGVLCGLVMTVPALAVVFFNLHQLVK
jgi:hypothetical protein